MPGYSSPFPFWLLCTFSKGPYFCPTPVYLHRALSMGIVDTKLALNDTMYFLSSLATIVVANTPRVALRRHTQFSRVFSSDTLKAPS